MSAKKSICFFCKVESKEVLQRVEFYAQDIAILNDLGYDLHIATRPQDLRRCDLFFFWWWSWGFLPVHMGRTPTLITGAFDYGEFTRRPKHQQALIRHASKRADASVFISRSDLEEVSSNVCINNPSYTPLTVDSEQYRPADVLREDFALCFAGSGMNGGNSRRKCIEELIRAAPIVHRQFPKLKFVIAGQKGSDYPALAQVVEEVGATEYIEFPGIVSKARKIELMQRCRVYLQPTRFEAFGLSILEAMSCGAPVVSSPVGSVPEVLGDSGIMIDGASPQAIADGAASLLTNTDLCRHLGNRARKRAVEIFPYERRKSELYDLIESLT